MSLLPILVVFSLGSILGSFMTCLADRLLKEESILHGRSHCDNCSHVLGPLDLIPVVSWLLHRGRCRYCGRKIPLHCFLSEAGLGFLSVLCAARLGASMEALRAVAAVSILLGLTLTDLAAQIIPDCFVASLGIVYALTLPFLSTDVNSSLRAGIMGALFIGGGISLLAFSMRRILKKEVMGGGDLKLLFVLGLYLGIGKGVVCILAACLGGLFMMAVRRSSKIPFGPFLALGFILSLLWGDAAVSAYLHLFGV